ncbi:phosphoglycerate kinase [archaeon]|nr:phosphoglycerate kinase [archaeon]
MTVLTIDNIDLKNKTVLARLDLNSPLGKMGELLDTLRIEENAKTVKELSNKGAKVVIIAHQGRPGDKEFTSLAVHAKTLEYYTKKIVTYIDDLSGSVAKHYIKLMRPGEIILLENVRFNSEELLDNHHDHSKTHMVRNLSPLIDYYINDAFAVSHRNHASIVGFPRLLPSIAGRIMQKEIEILTKVQKNPEKPCVLVFGGSKIKDTLNVIQKMFENNSADKALLSGVVAILFLKAKGIKVGNKVKALLKEKSTTNDILKARELMTKYNEKIILPIDVALDVSGKRENINIEQLPTEYNISDIGDKTIKLFENEIKLAKTIIANGPAGYFEKPPFDKGTKKILTAIANTKTLSVIGGGHTAMAAKSLGIIDDLSHISTGGGAFILFMTGTPLPGIVALIESKKKYSKDYQYKNNINDLLIIPEEKL